jgi:hypothetical protein
MKLPGPLGKLQCFRSQSKDEAPHAPPGMRPADTTRSAASSLRAAMQTPRTASGSRPATARFSAAAPATEPATDVQVARPTLPHVISNDRANRTFKAMADVASTKLQGARASQRATATALQAANAALAAVPAPTAAELAARSGPAQTVLDAAIHDARVAWEARMRPNRAVDRAEGPEGATYRPPANDGGRYARRWDRVTARYDAACAKAHQAYQDALDPPRAAAVKIVEDAQAADTAAIAAVEVARDAFVQVAALELASRVPA